MLYVMYASSQKVAGLPTFGLDQLVCQTRLDFVESCNGILHGIACAVELGLLATDCSWVVL